MVARPYRLDRDALYHALNQRRRTRRLTWDDVAAEMGISRNTLSRLLNNRTNPEFGTVLAVCGWLHTTDLGPYLTQGPTP